MLNKTVIIFINACVVSKTEQIKSVTYFVIKIMHIYDDYELFYIINDSLYKVNA
jgi:hypothetical protein